MTTDARRATASRPGQRAGAPWSPMLQAPTFNGERPRTAVPPAAHVPPEIVSKPMPRWKRLLDVAAALVLMAASFPLWLVIIILTKLDGGPAFFVQDRVGEGGEMIRVRKFRTMVVDAEKRLRADPEMYAFYVANGFKLPAGGDPRLTRVGRWLRCTSLDELPQLHSVLLGDMSMVGPRPIVPAELEEYRKRGYSQVYFSSRPGLTGLWQVRGRSTTTYDDRVAYDAVYLKTRSLRGDVSILLRTIPAVLRRHGAH